MKYIISGGDNLGNHIATKNLNLNKFSILNPNETFSVYPDTNSNAVISLNKNGIQHFRNYNTNDYIFLSQWDIVQRWISSPIDMPDDGHRVLVREIKTNDAPNPPFLSRPIYWHFYRHTRFSYSGQNGVNAFQSTFQLRFGTYWWNEIEIDTPYMCSITFSNGGWDFWGIYNGCISIELANYWGDVKRRFWFHSTNVLQFLGDNGYYNAGEMGDRSFCDTGIVMYDGAIFGLKWIRSFNNVLYFYPSIGQRLGDITSSTFPAITFLFNSSDLSLTKIRIGGTGNTTGGQLLVRNICSPDGTQHIRLSNTSVIVDPDPISNITQFRGQCLFDNTTTFRGQCLFDNITTFRNECMFDYVATFKNICIFHSECWFYNVAKFYEHCEFNTIGSPTNPTTPAGYIEVLVNGQIRYIPYYI